MAIPNPGMDAVPFTPLTAEFLDDMIENIEALSTATDNLSAVQTYTPSLTNITLGSGGTISGYYSKVGQTVNFTITAVLGGSGRSVATGASFGLPTSVLAANYDNSNSLIGVASVRGSDPTNRLWTGYSRIDTTGKINIVISRVVGSEVYTSGSSLTETNPTTWASGDTITAAGTYWASS